jgi:hypothetical protein
MDSIVVNDAEPSRFGHYCNLVTAAQRPTSLPARLQIPLAERPALPSFTPRQRDALVKLLEVRALLGRRGEWRVNWSDRAEKPVSGRTMNVLARRGHVLLERRSGFAVARLTRLGALYAGDLARVRR